MKNIQKIAKRAIATMLSLIMILACMTCSAISAFAAKGSSGAGHGAGGGHHDNEKYSYDGSIVEGSYNETYYVVPKSGAFYAKDTFSFKVDDDGSITLRSVKQKCKGALILDFDYNGYDIVEEGDKWIKVETYWYSNKEISFSIPTKYNYIEIPVTIPSLKEVTCHYTIYADGTVHLDEKTW